ncbi:MAG: polysulfide reductase NrfD [Pyrinomonadaceae bacterium MAG19_C2-C3]|nr:polysulfide reductase NrfD [Pyrinomonadaceae bacterium MAG19_C2-C3]
MSTEVTRGTDDRIDQYPDKHVTEGGRAGEELDGYPPVIAPGHSFASVTDKIASLALRKRTPIGWLFAFFIAGSILQLLVLSIAYLLAVGVGVFGNNQPVGWAVPIISFVWWIGIGHAGTLISAILLLFRQSWRTSINRFAEAMTLFAVACAGLYPLLHTGRPWLAYWMFPYPNTMGMWPQFRSPLIWDVFAVSTYASVSALFWFVGLVPDLATFRDKSRHWIPRTLFGLGALGWRGSARHWHRYETAYLLLAGLSTPLVLSVHTIVSFDFAVSIVPGWHATIFPPYFVAGAVYAGFAMVLTLLIPIRVFYGLEDFITMRHIHNCAKVMLATGLIVFYGYIMEAFFAWYSANIYERAMMWNRMAGSYSFFYWSLILCNGIVPQLLWSKRVRENMFALFTIAMFVNVGMWLERFIILITSLYRDFLPSSWGMYMPTIWDLAMFVGTLGFFVVNILLFIRLLPIISIFEMRTLLPEAKVHPEEEHKVIEDKRQERGDTPASGGLLPATGD